MDLFLVLPEVEGVILICLKLGDCFSVKPLLIHFQYYMTSTPQPFFIFLYFGILTFYYMHNISICSTLHGNLKLY